MAYILRATRYLAALIVSIHIAILSRTVAGADRKVAKCQQRVNNAREGVRLAQEAVRGLRTAVREERDKEVAATNDARNLRIAADAEARVWGRSL